MTAKLRAAVVGCGWIGAGVAEDARADGIQAHVAAYARCADTLLAGVCDRDPQRAAQVARRWGLAGGFTELSEMLVAVRPQIVSVCTPDATHAQVLAAVLSSPEVRAVIAEKPLALELAEARSLVELARRRSITLAVNYTRRYAPSHAAVQRRIAAGEIGEVVAISGLYAKGVVHNGSHWFDLARWLVGDIVRVQAWPAAARRTDAADPDPTCHVRLVFQGGQSGFLLGADAGHYTVFEMDCLGSKGRLRITDSGMRVAWSDAGDSPYYSGYRTLLPRQEADGGFRDAALHLVENVVAALAGREPVRCTGEDALAALAVASAARESLARGIECAVERIR